MKNDDNQPSVDAAYTFADATNKYLLDYIKFSDAKAGAISTACVIGMGVMANIQTHIALLAKTTLLTAKHNLYFYFSLFSFFAIAVAFICTLLSLYPRRGIMSPSLISYPSIIEFPAKVYASKIARLDKQSALEDLSIQNHNLSMILNKKFKHQQDAIQVLVIATISIIFSLIVSIFI